MKTEEITIDLSSLKKVSGRILAGNDVEFKIVEFYKYIQTDEEDGFTKFCNYILKELYLDSKQRDYTEILYFITEKQLFHNYYTFLGFMEVMIFNKIEPDFINIEFISWIENTEDKKICKFRIHKRGQHGNVSNT